MHTTFLLYLALLLAIVFLAMLAQRLKISYPIVLVLGGLLSSFIPGLPPVRIDPELIFIIFLPPLLYDAAWQTSWKDFWRWRRVIGSFAFLIVIVTSCVVAVVSHQVIPGFTLALGFLLGGIVSPPDAVSATTILKDVQVPKRLVTIIEGESLLNDASSLIVFRFALIAITTGAFHFQDATVSFFVVIIMGTVTGLAIALVFYALHRWLPTTSNMDIVLTLIAPYVMYITAEQFHFSGVLAVVSGGLFLSTRKETILTYRSRLQGSNVWETVGFVLNGIVFLLIGLQLPYLIEQLGPDGLMDGIGYGVLITVVLIVLRILSTMGASVFTVWVSHIISTADPNPGWRGPLLLGWAGMRGVVSLAAALSIPVLLPDGTPFPQRSMILFITFVVILLTLVVQGLTLPMLVRWVDMKEMDYVTPEKQEVLVKKKLANAALMVLNETYVEEVKTNDLLQSLKLKHEIDVRRAASYETGMPDIDPDNAAMGTYLRIARELIAAQREVLTKLNHKAEVDEALVRKYQELLDLEAEKLRLLFSADEA